MDKNEYFEKMAEFYHNACREAVEKGQVLVKVAGKFIEWTDLLPEVKAGKIAIMIKFIAAIAELSQTIAKEVEQKKPSWATELVEKEGHCLVCKKSSKQVIINANRNIEHYYCDEHLPTVLEFVGQFYND